MGKNSIYTHLPTGAFRSLDARLVVLRRFLFLFLLAYRSDVFVSLPMWKVVYVCDGMLSKRGLDARWALPRRELRHPS